MTKEIIITLAGSYLIGSFSTSVWLGRKFFNIDVREHGSGNAGATNTFRVLGKKAGTIVFILDVLKGVVATQLVLLFKGSLEEIPLITLQILAGIFAVIGHIFPIYTGFKGGKGVATLLGICLGFLTVPTLMSAAVFMLIFFSTGYVSLGSMIAGISLPVFVLVVFQYSTLSIILFVTIIPVLLLLTHKKNIIRLINREENKFYFRKNRH
jgi:acyl phosphate:glycerol-3-phosphate acyltransferase